VKKLELVQADPLLADAAMAAVKQWSFKPATLGGIPIEADVNINVNCELPKRWYGMSGPLAKARYDEGLSGTGWRARKSTAKRWA